MSFDEYKAMLQACVEEAEQKDTMVEIEQAPTESIEITVETIGDEMKQKSKGKATC